MKPIKVNFKDVLGNKTSTTVNGNIAFQYWIETDDCKNREDKSTLPDDYMKRVAKEVQKFVNEMDYQVSKDHIETSLIQALLAKKTDYYIELMVNRC